MRAFVANENAGNLAPPDTSQHDTWSILNTCSLHPYGSAWDSASPANFEMLSSLVSVTFDSATSFWPSFSTWFGLSVELFPQFSIEDCTLNSLDPNPLLSSEAPEIIRVSWRGLLVSSSSKLGSARPSRYLATGYTQCILLHPHSDSSKNLPPCVSPQLSLPPYSFSKKSYLLYHRKLAQHAHTYAHTRVHTHTHTTHILLCLPSPLALPSILEGQKIALVLYGAWENP